MRANTHRPALKLIPGELCDPVEWEWFCGHCAAPAPGGEAPAPTARVCPSCCLGLLLETRKDVVPSSADAFIVIDSALLVQAMSRRAEVLLGMREDLAVNRPITGLLVPADAETQGPERFATAISDAAGGGDAPTRVFVRPWNTFGVRIRARIAACGPPRAALLVLEGPATRELRSVPDA